MRVPRYLAILQCSRHCSYASKDSVNKVLMRRLPHRDESSTVLYFLRPTLKQYPLAPTPYCSDVLYILLVSATQDSVRMRLLARSSTEPADLAPK